MKFSILKMSKRGDPNIQHPHNFTDNPHLLKTPSSKTLTPKNREREESKNRTNKSRGNKCNASLYVQCVNGLLAYRRSKNVGADPSKVLFSHVCWIEGMGVEKTIKTPIH